MADIVVNENATSFVTVTFRDRNSSGVTPSSATWDLHDAIDGTALSTGNSIGSLSSQVTITVSQHLNNIRHGRTYERRRVTIRATSGTTERITGEQSYLIKNLGFAASTST